MTVSFQQGDSSVRESRVEKHLEDRLRWLAFLCGLPFIYFAIVHASLTTLILFQSYFLTASVAGIIGIRLRRVLSQRWFWKAIISSTPVHIAAIAGIFYWDKANTEIAFKGFYTIGIVWLAGVVEMLCIVGIIELWKPSSET